VLCCVVLCCVVLCCVVLCCVVLCCVVLCCVVLLTAKMRAIIIAPAVCLLLRFANVFSCSLCLLNFAPLCSCFSARHCLMR